MEEFTELHKTNWPDLLKHIRESRVQAAVLSFAWKLANRKIHITYKATQCSFCLESLTTGHILNGECKGIDISKGNYNALFTPPHTNLEPNFITLWSIWKA